jgi:hypothetical protein
VKAYDNLQEAHELLLKHNSEMPSKVGAAVLMKLDEVIMLTSLQLRIESEIL